MTQQLTLDLFKIDTAIPLDPCKGWPKAALHHFDRKQAVAVLAAKEIQRPLLVRGEPGCGKTQIARAVAQVAGMPLACLVVNERTETEDLFWKYDALRRLSDANNPKLGVQSEKKYLSAGPLWWALNQTTAEDYKGIQSSEPDRGDKENLRDYSQGVLLLIDEIDKADRSVPNSLLDALGNYSFDVPYLGERVECNSEAPLIIITTNNEQDLPAAFVRRCLVLDISLGEEKEFVATLAKRGKALFGGQFDSDDIFTTVANQLWEKRKQISALGGAWLPGQAEYLDHLEAVLTIKKHQPTLVEADAIEEMAELTYNKFQG